MEAPTVEYNMGAGKPFAGLFSVYNYRGIIGIPLKAILSE